MKLSPRCFSLITSVAMLVLAGGCASNEPADQRQIALTVDASSHEVLTGEIVTLTARTENALGRGSNVKWTCIGGDIKTEEDGRVARIKFKAPGMYTATARLYVDNRVMREDSTDIRVKPVN